MRWATLLAFWFLFGIGLANVIQFIPLAQGRSWAFHEPNQAFATFEAVAAGSIAAFGLYMLIRQGGSLIDLLKRLWDKILASRLAQLMRFLGMELRSPFHWLAGAISPLPIVFLDTSKGIPLSIGAITLFVIYEIKQGGDSHRDILQFIVAYFVTVGVVVLLNETLGWW